MKILLDNCIDRNLAALIKDHEVVHARDAGWRDLENGKLLAVAANAGFAAMVTVDKNIRYQQNLTKVPVAIVELDAARNRIDELTKFIPHISKALELTVKFAFVSIKDDGEIECLAER